MIHIHFFYGWVIFHCIYAQVRFIINFVVYNIAFLCNIFHLHVHPIISLQVQRIVCLNSSSVYLEIFPSSYLFLFICLIFLIYMSLSYFPFFFIFPLVSKQIYGEGPFWPLFISYISWKIVCGGRKVLEDVSKLRYCLRAPHQIHCFS